MRLRYPLTWFLRLFKGRNREIRPSMEELAKAREIMSKIGMNQEMDIIERTAKLKRMIEGTPNGER